MPVREVTPTELAAWLSGPPSERPILLDVRSAGENAYVALPGSVLIPLPELEERLDELIALKTQQRELVVYCHHGVRSLHGAAFLQLHEISASSLAGGIDRWVLEVDPTLRRY